ncbi:flavin reductase family protein [Pelagibacterium montanilacus]|uniref:flavin reductase family protein n=1 Tax=Pelagibacterium montanilacus TaxID=2185280 RepID=UPI001FE9E171|nr:flavin reductase family protein [Pelagibacterium montanilacus]
MARFHSYEPADGHRLPHDPLKAIVAPRPIGWISTLDGEGRTNLAPYSFFAMVSGNPPILMISSEGHKHTIANIEATGAFVYNLATRAQAEAMNLSSGTFPQGVDEFERAGLEKLPSASVAPPRVAGSPAHLECRVIETRPIRDMGGQPTGAIMALGQVVHVHIDESVLVDGLFDIVRAGTIARCGYRGDYVTATSVFEMIRPTIET